MENKLSETEKTETKLNQDKADTDSEAESTDESGENK